MGSTTHTVYIEPLLFNYDECVVKLPGAYL